ncbi:MAG TPA: amino acid permease [Candidatus Baltobacteraceae bacterium]|jgi:APA family basic amino acid/polyamine antiporter
MANPTTAQSTPGLKRRLGIADFTLITIGSVIGSGIFRNPAVVAQRAHSPVLIMSCWIAGGVLALIGAFVFAELASRRPENGGLYAYLRDAFGSGVGFVFVWMDFWLMYSGATAASAALFAGYVIPALGITADSRLVAVITLACVTLINILGVRQGAAWQNLLVVLKMGAIAALIVAGFAAHPLPAQAPLAAFHSPVQLLGALGVAMLPVLFAYVGFQSAGYITGEVHDPVRTVSRGLLLGVGIVVVVYLLVNAGCLRVLGAAGLAASTTPAADVMRAAFGPLGSRLIAIAIGISTLGYMSTSILLAPRIYFQLARDGMLFRQIAWVHPRTHVPVVAIALYGAMAAVLAASGTFAQIINWVTLPVWCFIALAAVALFVLRKRDAALAPPQIRVPGHPWTTLLLVVAVIGVVVSEIAIYPRDSIYAVLVAVVGAVVYAVVVRRMVSMKGRPSGV